MPGRESSLRDTDRMEKKMVGLAGSQEFYEYSAISLILLRWLWDRERQVT